MGKILVLLLAAFALALTFPSSRAVVAERAEPLMQPVHAWMTNQELNQIVEDLELHQETRGPLPSARGEFDEWMDGRYPQEPSREDAWGTRYELEVTGERFRVVSAGPDREFGTERDLRREGRRLRGRR